MAKWEEGIGISGVAVPVVHSNVTRGARVSEGQFARWVCDTEKHLADGNTGIWRERLISIWPSPKKPHVSARCMHTWTRQISVHYGRH